MKITQGRKLLKTTITVEWAAVAATPKFHAALTWR